MNLLTLDFETYYSQEYSLSKMNTESYIRDPRFETILMGYKFNDDARHWIRGPLVAEWFSKVDISKYGVLCHHAHFDGFILSHHYNQRPGMWFDTLSMARALHGTEVGGSLFKLLEHYQVGIQKDMSRLVDAKGKRFADFTTEQLRDYGHYCMDDVEGTYRIFMRMLNLIPKPELRQIDWVVRMFTEPKLYLDEDMLAENLKRIRGEKVRALLKARITQDELMSNDKFAEALIRLGVTPPKKISLTTGKPAYAFAKTDEGLTALLEDDDIAVQALVAARLKVKSTIAETRTVRMLEMAPRGPAPIYLKYAGAQQTMRLSGGDDMNWQNLTRGSALRDAIYCDEDHLLVPIDSRNIEARVIDWLAMQEDQVEAYRKFDRGEGPDIYCVMASQLFQKEITPDNKEERRLGKIVKLASGYQLGAGRLMQTARIGGIKLSEPDAVGAIEVYRQGHPMVVNLWARAKSALPVLAGGSEEDHYLDSRNLIKVVKGKLLLPNGLAIKFPHMEYSREGNNSWSYNSGRGKTHLYGGKVVENVVQALARIIVMDQTMEMHKRYPVVMHQHDEMVALVPKDEAEEALAYGLQLMSTPPTWAPSLPVAGEGAYARRYGEAK